VIDLNNISIYVTHNNLVLLFYLLYFKCFYCFIVFDMNKTRIHAISTIIYITKMVLTITNLVLNKTKMVLIITNLVYQP